ncbi:MAG: hypothetical protein UT02_C0012G0001, partial [Parcubacteria group bacterium GW2011_GWC2_38_7]
LYTKVNDYGFLEAPYRKVGHVKKGKNIQTKATSEITYMDASDERDHYVTHSGVLEEDQTIILDRIPARYKGEFIESNNNNCRKNDKI